MVRSDPKAVLEELEKMKGTSGAAGGGGVPEEALKGAIQFL